MKQIVKIDVEKNGRIITKLFNIDETISDGFYFTMDDKKVKTNIKSFDAPPSISLTSLGQYVIHIFSLRW